MPQTLHQSFHMKLGIIREGFSSLGYTAVESFAARIDAIEVLILWKHLEEVNKALGTRKIGKINKGVFRKNFEYPGVCAPVNGQSPRLNRVPDLFRAIIVCQRIFRT